MQSSYDKGVAWHGRARRAAEQPEIEALESECASLQSEIAALNTDQARRRAQCNEVKLAIAELKDRTSAAAFATVEAHDEASRLRARIVPDPAAHRAALEAAVQAVEDEKAAVLEADRRRREASSKRCATGDDCLGKGFILT